MGVGRGCHGRSVAQASTLSIDYLIVGGGGGGGDSDWSAAGGGAGAVVTNLIGGTAAGPAQSLAAGSYAITVGSGGAFRGFVSGGNATGLSGTASTAFGLTALGGGGGAGTNKVGGDGGSGGGVSLSGGGAGGTSLQFSTYGYGLGFSGGSSVNSSGDPCQRNSGNAARSSGGSGTASLGGGGGVNQNGLANTGGGGGATGSNDWANYGGGSGVVLVRYLTASGSATGGTKYTQGEYTVHAFNSSGTFEVLAVPEPSSLALLGSGVLALRVAWHRRRRKAAAA